MVKQIIRIMLVLCFSYILRGIIFMKLNEIYTNIDRLLVSNGRLYIINKNGEHVWHFSERIDISAVLSQGFSVHFELSESEEINCPICLEWSEEIVSLQSAYNMSIGKDGSSRVCNRCGKEYKIEVNIQVLFKTRSDIQNETN